MKVCIYFFVLTSFFKIDSANAQNAKDFLIAYNKRVDPFGRLDSIKVLTLKMVTKIKYSTGSTFYEINNVRLCNFYADGTRSYLNPDGSKAEHLEINPIPKEFSGNAIKYQLEFIAIDEGARLSFQLVNDSITVIEKDMGSRGKHVFTFDSNTKHLLQRSTINDDGSYVSYTNYVSYQTVNDIIVREKITFSNQTSIATIEYENIEFKFY